MSQSAAKGAEHANVNLLGVTYNTGNYGVHALLSGTVQRLALAHQNLAIRILDYGPEPAVWREPTAVGEHSLELINLRFSWKLYLPNNILRLLVTAAMIRLFPPRFRPRLVGRNRWLKKISEAEANLSLAGGDSFSDIYGLKRLFYVCLPQILVLCLDKPLLLLPQTYGPFNSGAARFIARLILNRATLVYTRDLAGVGAVRALLGKNSAKASFAPDVGFVLDAEPAPEDMLATLKAARNEDPLVGFNISSLLYMGGYTRNNMFGLKEDYPKLIDAVLKLLIRDLGARVLLTPHLGCGRKGSEDGEFSLYRQLMPQWEREYQSRVLFFDAALNHRQMKSLIGNCDFFIGARMHACIAAASQGVPTVGMAYSGKFAGVLQSVDPEMCVVDLRVSDISSALKAIHNAFAARAQCKRRLEENLPGIKTALAALFDGLDFPSAPVGAPRPSAPCS